VSLLQTISCCLHIADLISDMHRFAVAWYPIYRISDGPLRSVFLTYHSLGHCIPSDKKLGQYAGLLQEGLSFPVVGLESYNTQVLLSLSWNTCCCLWKIMCWVSNLVNKTRNYELHYFLVNIPYVDIRSTSEAVSILCISSVLMLMFFPCLAVGRMVITGTYCKVTKWPE
jgi:hypothetical protein